MHRSVVSVGVDPLVGQDLDVFPAGAAVQLVGSCQPAAHSVRQPALLGDMVLEIRRGLHSVLSDNRKHMSRNMKLLFNVGDFFLLCKKPEKVNYEEKKLASQTAEAHSSLCHSSHLNNTPCPFFFRVFVSFWRCFHGPSGMTFPSDGLFLPPMIFHPFLTSSFFSHFSRSPSTCVLTITF